MERRLHWLDAARGIAVLLVVFAHTLDYLWPHYTRFVQLGNAGVVLFFLCSGYVIAISLDSLSFRDFWVRRFFRLYPLYWCSLVLFLALGMSDHSAAGVVLVNVTMLQSLVGMPDISTIYWSLGVEITFYIVSSILQLAGLHRHSTIVFLALAGLGLSLSLFVDGLQPAATALPICAFGVVVYRYDQGRYTNLWLRVLMVGLVGYILLLFAPIAFTVGWLLALLLFLILHAHQARRWPSWLVWCGLVSYSVYLLHPLPLFFTQGWGWPLIFPLAALGYAFVEAPAIRLGRRLSRPAGKPKVLNAIEA